MGKLSQEELEKSYEELFLQITPKEAVKEDKTEGMRYCRICGHKPEDEFYGESKGTKENTCKKCLRILSRAKKWGLSLEIAEALEEGRVSCDSCGSRKKICVDHDHSTGEVRGFLCSSCNISLGLLEESLERMKGLIAYVIKIKKPKSRRPSRTAEDRLKRVLKMEKISGNT